MSKANMYFLQLKKKKFIYIWDIKMNKTVVNMSLNFFKWSDICMTDIVIMLYTSMVNVQHSRKGWW